MDPSEGEKVEGLRNKRGVASFSTSSDVAEIDWWQSAVAQDVLARKYSLLVMLSLYDRRSINTSALIRELDAHPATVITVLRDLERLGILRRRRQLRGRHELRASLTLRGMQLIETPLYRWGRLIRDWASAP